jgi:hypothetical protein
MRTRVETIKLGERDWALRPLTLRQVQEIEPILLAGAPEAAGNVTAAMAIVAIALRRDHAEAAAALGDVEATATEIGAAMAAVLRLGGFLPSSEGGDKPGEA